MEDELLRTTQSRFSRGACVVVILAATVFGLWRPGKSRGNVDDASHASREKSSVPPSDGPGSSLAATNPAVRTPAEPPAKEDPAPSPSGADAFSDTEWESFPRESAHWLFAHMSGTPRDLIAKRIVRCAAVNPRDVRVDRTQFAELERIVDTHRAALDQLQRGMSEVQSQEIRDLVATGLAPKVEPATEENMTPEERPEFDGWVVLYTQRMKEEPRLVDIWGTPQRMALAKVSEARAGQVAMCNADGVWFKVPRDKLLRTAEFNPRLARARDACFGDLTQWSERCSLSKPEDVAKARAEHDAFWLRVAASLK